MINFSKVLDIYSGRASLAATYWVGLFLSSFPLVFIGHSLMQAYIVAEDPAVIARLDMADNVHTVLLVAFYAVMVRAIWKSARNDRTPGFWGWTAIIVSVLGLLRVSYVAATVFLPGVPVPLILIEQELRDFNKNLPQDTADGGRILSVRLKDDAMVYRISYPEELPVDDGESLSIALDLDDPTYMELCQDMENYFLGGVREIVFEYRYTNATYTEHLSGSKCLNALKRL